MKKIRIIPRLDVKGPNVIKGIHLEGLRVVGDPALLAKRYYEQGADEILYMDIVASLYERKNILEVIRNTISQGVYIPLTVGGGIRTIEDIREILRSGADKVAINTAATKNPEFITKASKIYGSQCIVGSIEAKKVGKDKWEAYIDNGREKTGLDVLEWAKKLVELGAGELLITSVDMEGVQKGYDIELNRKIISQVDIPVIISGGAGNLEHIYDCFQNTHCDSISMASILHYNKFTIDEIKLFLSQKGIPVRTQIRSKNSEFKTNLSRKTVSIIDYGLGNLESVINGFQYVGNKVKIVDSPDDIAESDLLVLPGVGAFEDGMKGLKKKKILNAINEYAELNKPLLGICLGMQLLLSESEEFGKHKGLDIIHGRVIKFQDPSENKTNGYRVPQIGWNNISKTPNQSWEDTILNDVPDKAEVYFVHSFYTVPEDKSFILAETTFGGQTFGSILKKGNIYGCQFHPEKSGEVGLRILDSFGRL